MGMAIQLCEEEDHKIVQDLQGSLFGPLEFSRRDLMALNIQRGRDHGVPDYNSARRAYGLAEVKHVSHFEHVNASVYHIKLTFCIFVYSLHLFHKILAFWVRSRRNFSDCTIRSMTWMSG